jgi:multidrug resistance efflux pump
MLIVLGIYALVIWLLFFKLNILPWNMLAKWIVSIIGLAILLVVIGALNKQTPSGAVSLVGRVVKVGPTVEGRIVEINVAPNVLIKKGDPLFKVDPAPYRNTVNQLSAETGLAKLRLSQAERLATTSAGTQFRVEEADSLATSLSAQLAEARRQLRETTVVAPHDGFITYMEIAVGDWATPRSSSMAFIVRDDLRFMGTFGQNGIEVIQPGAPVRLALNSDPGVRHETEVLVLPPGVGQGQIDPGGKLLAVGEQPMTSAYTVLIAVPESLPPHALQLGMSGTATVLPEDAGPIAVLAEILLWIGSWVMYL